MPSTEPVVDLAEPRTRGSVSVEEAILRRRSERAFASDSLTPAALSQLLWAAQGITGPRETRAAPSAGALYPLDLYVVSAAGIGHYAPEEHRLLTADDRDARPMLELAAGQPAVGEAPAVIVLTAVFDRLRPQYGARAERYAALEAGHVAQNVLLEAVALGLAAVPVGAFDDEAVKGCLGLPPDHAPLYLIPVGLPPGGRGP